MTAPQPSAQPATRPTSDPAGRHLGWLTLGALGVVFGDLGTSPLYALQACFNGPSAPRVSQPR